MTQSPATTTSPHPTGSHWKRLGAAIATGLLAGDRMAVAEPAPSPSQPSRQAVTRRIVVSIPDRKLALLENGEVVNVFPVAVGSPETPSPAGTFTIVTRVSNPTYYHPGKIILPGPANPLGTRWLGLSVPGFGIHGTNDAKSIGRPRSHGCIRMRNSDVELLFSRVQSGDVVELRGERTVETARLFTAP